MTGGAMDSRKAVIAALAVIAPEADLDSLAPLADVRDELDLDSMDFLNFVTGIYERTGIEVPERDYPRLLTLDACVRYLDAHQQQHQEDGR